MTHQTKLTINRVLHVVIAVSLVLSVIGFGTGHLVGLWRGWIFFPLGSLNLGMSTLGSIVILLLGDWLNRFENKS